MSLDYIAGRTNVKSFSLELRLNRYEINLIDGFRRLSERNKGKLELVLEQLIDSQK